GAVLPVGALRLAANAGESFRVPTLIDLYYPGFSNPNLQPERSRNLDVTLQAPNLLGGLSLAWFGRAANDLIVYDQNFVPQNAQHASIQGITATAHSRPLHGIVASLALTDLYQAIDTSPGAGDARLKFQPTVQATLGLERPFIGGGPAFGIRAQIVGPHIDFYSAPGGGSPAIDAYATIDAYLRLQLAHQAVLTLRARNIGNEFYAPIYGYPAPGRTYSLELSTR
ncbi:MAG: TonB-dependent receptor, partial [bacterium]|nr:TonB-dependent receptor [bacterium]